MGRGPDIWVTDQDPAMKIAIKRVFPDSIHRLCMWHISKKFTEKIGSVLCSEKEFLDKLDAVVWNRYHEPAEFEDAWKQLIDEYGLHGNKWLSDMFDMRQNWIPAFFRDVPMGGLLRTTSRSESENSFFNCFLHSGMSLTEFFLAFETAMDAQRHSKNLMDHESANTFPACRTSLHIEKHAAEVFTRSIFFYVQREIYAACVLCNVSSISENEGVKTYCIKDKSTTSQVFKVVHHIQSNDAECSCKNYMRIGILCRHIFVALKSEDVSAIPNHFIKKRWTKNALDNYAVSADSAPEGSDDSKSVMNELWLEFNALVKMIGCDKENISDLLGTLRAFKSEKIVEPNSMSKADLFEKLIGTSRPAEIIVQTPQQAKNKGSGRRLKSDREKVIERAKRPPRKCAFCKKMVNHDIRNCPEKQI